MLTLIIGVLIGVLGLALLPDNTRNMVVDSVKSLKSGTLKLIEDKSNNAPKAS